MPLNQFHRAPEWVLQVCMRVKLKDFKEKLTTSLRSLNMKKSKFQEIYHFIVWRLLFKDVPTYLFLFYSKCEEQILKL